MSNWFPVQGNEVQVVFRDGYVEIAKFIRDNNDGTCDVRVGRKQKYTVKCGQVYQNCPPYKKKPVTEKEKFVRSARDMNDEKEYLY